MQAFVQHRTTEMRKEVEEMEEVGCSEHRDGLLAAEI